MRQKNVVRDNNVDATRSTMQKKVNNLHKILTVQMTSAQRKNLKMRRIRCAIHKLVVDNVISYEQFKDIVNGRKTHNA